MLGLHFTGIFSKDDAAGLAFSNVINGNPFLNSMQQQGVEIFASESIIECTYQYAVITGLILQPDIQLFINPNTEPTRPTMLVTGMRFIATL
jgi:carbohydrate-selective porin OprB